MLFAARMHPMLTFKMFIDVRPYEPCDRDTAHSFWATAFILHMMIVPWEKKNPIDFG